jgi:hypothetical protein
MLYSYMGYAYLTGRGLQGDESVQIGASFDAETALLSDPMRLPPIPSIMAVRDRLTGAPLPVRHIYPWIVTVIQG